MEKGCGLGNVQLGAKTLAVRTSPKGGWKVENFTRLSGLPIFFEMSRISANTREPAGVSLRSAPNLKMYTFKTIVAMARKLGDFFKTSSGNILTLVSHDQQL